MTKPKKNTPAWPLQVFYDGACRVCAAEIAHYRQLDHGGRMEFVDISAASFDADDYAPTKEEFMARMHVRDASGHYWRGVEAFPAIWRALPGRRYRWLATLLELPGIFQLARLGYWLFARLRKYLPKRGGGCGSDQCDLHQRS